MQAADNRDCSSQTPASPAGVEISVEFFPPRSPQMAERLVAVAKRLQVLAPTYASVTYGAGGSTQDQTLETIQRLRDRTGIAMAAHLTCVGATRAEVDRVARRFHAAGIGHIVALRGDPPEGHERYLPHPGGYAYAVDLVAGLKRIADFRISVAAYPEVHPEAASAEADLDNLKRKLDAGADEAITQFFFDSDAFLRFLDRARAAGIHAPIIPGVLPIANFKSVVAFANRCGAQVPNWLYRRFQGLENGGAEAQEVALDVAFQQCRYLLDHGIDALHFYTLNKDELTRRVCRLLAAKSSATRAAGHYVSSPAGPLFEGLRA